MKNVMIEFEILIRIIERTNDEEILKEIGEILTKNDLMRYVPRRLQGKLIKSRGTVNPSPDEIEDIREDTSEDVRTLREDLKKLIDKLPLEELEALWERYEDYMIEIELDKDPNFFKYLGKVVSKIHQIFNICTSPSFDKIPILVKFYYPHVPVSMISRHIPIV